MTEAEWLTSEDPSVTDESIWAGFTERKLRLAACGCCRASWGAMPDPRSRAAVEVSERFADGRADADELRAAAWRAAGAEYAVDEKEERYRREQKGIRAGWLGAEDAVEFPTVTEPGRVRAMLAEARAAASAAALAAGSPLAFFHEVPKWLQPFSVIRDVLGNPFRPLAFSPDWRTPTAVALGRQMYEGRDFSAMPILADALQDAGCENPDVLDHCRGPGPHARGCWVVDLVLGQA